MAHFLSVGDQSAFVNLDHVAHVHYTEDAGGPKIRLALSVPGEMTRLGPQPPMPTSVLTFHGEDATRILAYLRANSE